MVRGIVNMPLLAKPHGPGNHTPRPCPVCGATWRPAPFSRLPCHARCLLNDEGVRLVQALWDTETFTLTEIAAHLELPKSVLGGTLRHRLGIRTAYAGKG